MSEKPEPKTLKEEFLEYLEEHFIPKSKIKGLVAEFTQQTDKVHNMGLCTGRDYLYRTLKELLARLGEKEKKKP